ncbi:MAG: hypothetical protein ACRDN6_13285 [Gaiellaceae bacterium]
MVGLTRSSKPARNGRAWASVLVGLPAAAALPAAVVAAEIGDLIRLIEAAGAIPVAAVLGIGAIVLARRARRRTERTLGRVGGRAVARVGRALGVLAVCLALSASIAVGFYLVLTRVAD